MKRFALLFAAATLGLSYVASAQNPDLGQGPETSVTAPHRWYGRQFDIPTVGSLGLQPLYYKPTMRYYGNGYTVSYRYVPVYRQDSIYFGGMRASSNFRTEGFELPTSEIPSWGANAPRVTVKDLSSSAPRSAVTTIIRKKTTRTSVKTEADSDAPVIKH